MTTNYGTINGLFKSKGIVGPWVCSDCGHLSQFCDIQWGTNRVFCKNESCKSERIIDKKHKRIREPDGTLWQFDDNGRKMQVRNR